jgi:PAS domain S-box-containing protein
VLPEPDSRGWLNRAVFARFAFGVTVLTAAAWWYYSVERAQAEAGITRELTAVTAIKVRQISNWRRERMGDGRVLMASPFIEDAARILAGDRGGPGPKELANFVAQMEREFLYSSAALVDLDGSVRFLGPATLNAAAASKLAHQVVLLGVVVMSDIVPAPDAAHPMIHIAVPVRSQGALILDIDPRSFLYPYLETWPGALSTAETLLVRREGSEVVFLSPRRAAPNAPFFGRRFVADIGERTAANEDAGWKAERPDYRGVNALGAIRHVPDSTWYLVAKVDHAEAIGPLKYLEWQMSITLALLALTLCAAALVMDRNQRAKFLRQRDAWFRAVINDTPAYLWMASPEEKTAFVNQPLARFLGPDWQSGAGRWSARVHPEDRERISGSFHDAVSARAEYAAEYRLQRSDGEYRWVNDRGLPRFSETGAFLGYAGAIEDITGRLRAEHQLRYANAALEGELAERTQAQREVHQLSARLIDAQEDERKRLARELHDDFNQQIAALTIAMGNLNRGIPQDQAPLKAQGERIFANLAGLSEDIRRVSHELHPAALEYSGLASALREYCAEFQALTGIRVGVRIPDALNGVPSGCALTAYRIAQEALQNVAKHSGSKEATVELATSDGIMRMCISDRGIGIGVPPSGRAAGLGLVSMKERARLAGGKLAVERAPEGGTVVTLEAPIEIPAAAPQT